MFTVFTQGVSIIHCPTHGLLTTITAARNADCAMCQTLSAIHRQSERLRRELQRRREEMARRH